MQMNFLTCVLLTAALIAGCDAPSTESQSTGSAPPARTRTENPDRLSVDGELFPLSTYFGVCAKNTYPMRSTYDNGLPSPHFPTYVEIVGDGGDLKISVGKLGTLPGTVFEDITPTSLPRRIQVATFEDDKDIIVSNFENAGNNRVIIDYDQNDAEAEAAAIRLANNVVACRVSIVPSKTNDR